MKRENYKPFGPPLGKTKLESSLVNSINEYVDNNLLTDEEKRKQLNASNTLVGKVSEEIFLEKEFVEKTLLKPIYDLSKEFVSKNENITIKSLIIDSCWIVRQFESEYNPVHSHSGSLSGVLYLKVPEEKINQKDGAITFINSPNAFLLNGHKTFVPEKGDIFIFPSYLLHTVYPIRKNNSERRSLAFNLTINK